jgi:hypothetical protein
MHLDTVLLLALPASGKSEVRRYLAQQDSAVCRSDFALGETVQLDDFPYVHLMRQLDHVAPTPVFFSRPDRPFIDARDWGTLIELLNEDYRDLFAGFVAPVGSAARWLYERIERARTLVGAAPFLPGIPENALALLEHECRDLLAKKVAATPASMEGKTIVIEFARGGRDGAVCPLPSPFGYQYSLSRLSEQILERARVLYVWVTPEESRRKNDARTDPNDPGSILHHGVPIDVMLNDYGCDDIAYLMDHSPRADHLRLEAHGKVYHLPVARFDNRLDKTSFVREAPEAWAVADVAALHNGLSEALCRLASA